MNGSVLNPCLTVSDRRDDTRDGAVCVYAQLMNAINMLDRISGYGSEQQAALIALRRKIGDAVQATAEFVGQRERMK